MYARRWYIVPPALAKRSGKPGRRADGHRRSAAEQRNDGGQRAAALREPPEAPGKPSTLHPGAGASAGDASARSRLAAAETARRTGDFRTARSLAREVAAQGDDREREQARRILVSLSPDRVALLAAACVLLVIALAAILALFRAR
jgi:hypothetical protein